MIKMIMERKLKVSTEQERSDELRPKNIPKVVNVCDKTAQCSSALCLCQPQNEVTITSERKLSNRNAEQ